MPYNRLISWGSFSFLSFEVFSFQSFFFGKRNSTCKIIHVLFLNVWIYESTDHCCWVEASRGCICLGLTGSPHESFVDRSRDIATSLSSLDAWQMGGRFGCCGSCVCDGPSDVMTCDQGRVQLVLCALGGFKFCRPILHLGCKEVEKGWIKTHDLRKIWQRCMATICWVNLLLFADGIVCMIYMEIMRIKFSTRWTFDLKYPLMCVLLIAGTRSYNGACDRCFIPGVAGGPIEVQHPWCPMDILESATYKESCLESYNTFHFKSDQKGLKSCVFSFNRCLCRWSFIVGWGLGNSEAWINGGKAWWRSLLHNVYIANWCKLLYQ